ncbi:hypothetical protein ACFDTO_10040 [Microbacteriaceae bacterium 4G12]
MSATASHRPSFSVAWPSRAREAASTTVAIDRAEVLWLEVETGLWVGRVEGEFRGMIELTAEGFAATDGRGGTRGVHSSFARAKRSLATESGVLGAWRRATVGKRAGATEHDDH